MLEHFGDVIGNGKGKPPMKAAATKQTPMKAMKAKTPMKTKKVISKTTPSPMKANKSKPSPVIVASASALRFPGVPTKPVAPLVFGGYKIPQPSAVPDALFTHNNVRAQEGSLATAPNVGAPIARIMPRKSSRMSRHCGPCQRPCGSTRRFQP
eukprot:3122193-Pyramimonas_sp.AAC.1